MTILAIFILSLVIDLVALYVAGEHGLLPACKIFLETWLLLGSLAIIWWIPRSTIKTYLRSIRIKKSYQASRLTK